MGKPHKWADVIKAAADGETVQYRESTGSEWREHSGSDAFAMLSWSGAGEYRIKPEPAFPETRMTDAELVSKYFNGGPVSNTEEYLAWRRIANTAIRRAIQDGDVILPNKE